MGLKWEREERRKQLEADIQMAYMKAIHDAMSEYDDNDADLLRSHYLEQQDVPLPEGGKEILADANH